MSKPAIIIPDLKWEEINLTTCSNADAVIEFVGKDGSFYSMSMRGDVITPDGYEALAKGFGEWLVEETNKRLDRDEQAFFHTCGAKSPLYTRTKKRMEPVTKQERANNESWNKQLRACGVEVF